MSEKHQKAKYWSKRNIYMLFSFVVKVSSLIVYMFCSMWYRKVGLVKGHKLML